MHNLPYIRLLRRSIQDLVNEKNRLQEIVNNTQAAYLNSLTELSDSKKLQLLEIKFGGYTTNVKPTIDDPKKLDLVSNHTGGDRMNVAYHDYSNIYANYLKKFKSKKINLLEVGILKGTGLAIWSEYFENVNIFAFDWDLGNFNGNLKNLKNLGAFKKSEPKLFEYNQLIDNSKWLSENFDRIKFDVIIDDALHTDKAIINSFKELEPYFSNEIVYFIEDNKTAWKLLRKSYENYSFENYGEITVVTKK